MHNKGISISLNAIHNKGKGIGQACNLQEGQHSQKNWCVCLLFTITVMVSKACSVYNAPELT